MADVRSDGELQSPQAQAQAVKISVWEIDARHTTVEFGIKHMMFTTVKGRFTGVRGTITIDEANPAMSSVEAVIDVRTIDTGEPQRDTHLRSPDFFDADRYPTMRFKTTRVERIGDRKAKAYGDLTIRGVTRTEVLDSEYFGRGRSPWGQDVAGFHAETTINRSDFGLKWNAALETGGFLVGDEVKVDIDVEAIRKQ